MDKYLPEILKVSNTVIIPEIGALTLTNHATGELMFMPYLKHDDGKFAKYIAEKEGIDFQESANLLAKFIREMQAKLDQGEVYRIFKFGSFIKEADGSISFSQWQEVVDANSDVKPDLADEIILGEDLSESQTEPKLDTSSTVDVFPNEDIAPSSPELVSEPEESPVLDPTIKKELNIAEKEELEKNVEKLAALKKQKENKETRKSKSPVFYILIGFLAILISASVYVGFNFQDLKQHIPFLADQVEDLERPDHLNQMKKILGKTDSDEREVVKDKPVIEGSVSEAEPEPAEISEEPAEKVVVQVQSKKTRVPSSTGMNFHLIAGVFSVPENAQRMADKLGSEGYSAVVVVRGAQHFVKMQSFSSKEEALQAISGAKNHAPKVWLLSGNLD